jgi:hypothetical protein
MRKVIFTPLLAFLFSIIMSCGGSGGGSYSSDNVSVTGKITTPETGISSASVKIGNTQIAYISALSVEKNKKLKTTVAKIKDDGSFKLKLKKNRRYSFVLYDEDGNPVLGIKKGSKNAFEFLDDATINIVLGDKNGDGRPDIISLNTNSSVEEVADENIVDNNNNNIPDNAENTNIKDDDEDKDYDNDSDDKEHHEDNDNGNNDNDNDHDNDNGNNNNNDNDNGNNYGENNGGNNGDNTGENNGGNTGGGNNGGNNGNLFTTSNGYTILAWNDLGMHCMDGNDYSVFSILPPYNTLHAHVIKKGGEPDKLKNVDVTYEAVADPDTGSINTISSTKTNFWQYVKKLFGVDVPPDVGLAGKPMQSTTPAPMDYNSKYKIFQAEGIPITPYDDNGNKNFYPLTKVVAKDSNGNILAATTTVLPVSDEMDCRACHGSNSGYNATKPSSGWENDPDPEKDYKYNILKLHDDKHDISAYLSDLQAKGYDYQPSLYQTAKSGTPILCAACHRSNALPNTGINGIPQLTTAIHSKHATAIDPTNGKQLNAISNRSSCYRCHPGLQTQCLRGAMGGNGVQCQDCHGSMAVVGKSGREGWLDMPNCQACHHDGIRELTAIVNGKFRQVSDNRFATNPDTPSSGYSLYRFSKGHKGIQCEACHGSTHAIYPSTHKGDNLQSIALQGYKGTITECTVCHGNNVPLTNSGGPHGMHTIGQKWVDKHGDYAEHNSSSCTACHGKDYRGSFLSELKTTKTFNTEWGTKTFNAGHKISCYDCHNGPKGD